jgi:crotonobetaine/carnitine-CoA ligase
VVDAAAIAVDADLGEDEILVAVVKRPDAELDAVDIRDWCAQRLAPIKVPRYVVFVQSLPYTPTHRVAKYRLKEDKSLRSRAVDVQARS